MAARKRKGVKGAGWHETTKRRLSTTMLMKRLEAVALGKQKLTEARVRAIGRALDKTLPDAGLPKKKLRGQYDRKAAGLVGPRKPRENAPTGS